MSDAVKLGREAARAGRTREAADHFRTALQAAPGDFGVLKDFCYFERTHN